MFFFEIYLLHSTLTNIRSLLLLKMQKSCSQSKYIHQALDNVQWWSCCLMRVCSTFVRVHGILLLFCQYRWIACHLTNHSIPLKIRPRLWRTLFELLIRLLIIVTLLSTSSHHQQLFIWCNWNINNLGGVWSLSSTGFLFNVIEISTILCLYICHMWESGRFNQI